MAKMYPSGNLNFINNSEKEFYTLLKEHPDTKEWTVFYSHRMVSTKYINEVDFLVLIKDLGISLIELKANNPISISPDTFKYNYMGRIEEKENPFRKIKNLVSQFKTVLKSQGKDLEKIFVSHIIIFPEYNGLFDRKICFSDSADNYITALTEKEKIPSQILNLHQRQSQSVRRMEAAKDVNEINGILTKVEEILKHEIDLDENALLIQFEKENKSNLIQSMLSRWFMIENLKKAILVGPAGSGKTFSCIQQMIKKRKEKKTIAYFCHGALLARKLSKEFREVDNVEIFELRDFLCKKLKKSPDEKIPIQGLIKDMINLNPRPKYDLIVADEGEFYLSNDFLSLSNKLLKGGLKDGFFWAAFDECILEREQISAIDKALDNFELSGLKIKLSVNYRNSFDMSSLFSSFCGDKLYEKSEVSNLSQITSIFYSDSQEASISATLEALLTKYRPSEITFLSPKHLEESFAGKLRRENRSWGKKMSQLSHPQEGFFNYGDPDSFSGMESRVVIITDLDEDFFSNPRAGKILYKMASSSLFKLVFLVHEKARDTFKQYLTRD